MTPLVHFRLNGAAAELKVAPPLGELVTFERGEIEVTLEAELFEAEETTSETANVESENSLTAILRKAGLSMGPAETGNCLVEARTTREVSQEVYAFLAEKVEMGHRETTWLLEPARLLIEDVYAELNGEAAGLVQILRWVFNSPWPAKPLGDARLNWSLDREHWHAAPKGDEDAYIEVSGEVRLDAELAEVVADLWQSSELVEPLARQILLEAIDLQNENSRAAFILAVVAAEVGVKQFAAERSSSLSEAWLLEEIQSPPLDRLLRQYLVRLTEKKTTDGPTVPTAIVATLEKALKKRNRLIHRGEGSPTEAELVELLVTVNNLLYLLDWFAGHEWAFHRLQDEIRTAYEA